ncbi:MAG: LPS export ABC transporter periplasmic protein LptC [Flavobacteriales bacterium]|nr:LPS export ABC transporter periplasmic protein LptC [Flavobacteriales bacterium]MCB9190988.1 LPS export ABC transporter periplasmic protein LptC [Flavobacteriales bacterium]MCB9204777.1 LPS export ABC transporter periplasmic protein LptC [Flavobacteriales bacterium]
MKQLLFLLTDYLHNITFKKVRTHVRLCLFLFGALLINTGCVNDLQQVEAIMEDELKPVEVADSVQIVYSDSAMLKVILEANHLERFLGENPYLEMTQGVHVRFFNNMGQVESELRSNYAVSYENTDIMEAKEDVVVVNKEGETLNTEHLIWEEKTERIHTEEFVKITTEDEVIFGHGFESNQDFTKYRIKKIKGTINLKEDAESTEGS